MNPSNQGIGEDFLETVEIKMSQSAFLNFLFLENGLIWGLVAIGAILGFVIASFFGGFRWLVVALMWLFIVIPMMMAYFYFFYGMKMPTAVNCIEHKITFRQSNCQIIIPHKKRENETNVSEDHNNIKDPEDFPTLQPTIIDIPYSSYKEMKLGAGCVYLLFNKPYEGFLWLPSSSFENGSQFNENLDWIISRLKTGTQENSIS